MNQNIIKLIVIIIFPWGLHSKCPCTHREAQPTSISPRGCPASGLVSGPAVVPLGTPQTLIWPSSCVYCPQSPQLPELDGFLSWEHALSTQIFHRCRVYLADCRDLTCRLYSWWKDFQSSSLDTPSLWFSFGLSPPLHVVHPQESRPEAALELLGLPQWGQGIEVVWVLGSWEPLQCQMHREAGGHGCKRCGLSEAFSGARHKAHEGQSWLGFFWHSAAGAQGQPWEGLFF